MIVRALEVVGLGERADDRVKTYSHGMKQRLGLAQALLGDPELIVLDEPTSGLDPQGMKEVRDLLTHLSRANGTTIFLSSHLLAEVGQSASHMAIINEGKLVVQGRVDDLLQSGGHLVRVAVRPVETAARVIEQLRFVTGLRRVGEELEVTMPHEHIRTLNRALVEAGVDVDALVPKRSLEEYFLAITEHASDGRTAR
jgi:ABC-2 type transport system ATP-binding protein